MILGEVFSDYTPAQVVVKELRASAGPLEQRKFISEAQPYRYAGRGPEPKCPGVRPLEVTFGSGRSRVRGQSRVRLLDLPLPCCAALSRELPPLSPGFFLGTEPGMGEAGRRGQREDSEQS